jgi:hypothetical protein
MNHIAAVHAITIKVNPTSRARALWTALLRSTPHLSVNPGSGLMDLSDFPDCGLNSESCGIRWLEWMGVSVEGLSEESPRMSSNFCNKYVE